MSHSLFSQLALVPSRSFSLVQRVQGRLAIIVWVDTCPTGSGQLDYLKSFLSRTAIVAFVGEHAEAAHDFLDDIIVEENMSGVLTTYHQNLNENIVSEILDMISGYNASAIIFAQASSPARECLMLGKLASILSSVASH